MEIKAAALLADIYDDIELLKLNDSLNKSQTLSASNNTLSLITKKAILSAVSIDITSASDEIIYLIGRALIYLPFYYEDEDFMINIIHKINILPFGVLTEIKQAFYNLRLSLELMNQDTSMLDRYEHLLFDKQEFTNEPVFIDLYHAKMVKEIKILSEEFDLQRYNILVDYFKTSKPILVGLNGEITHLCHYIDSLALYCKFDPYHFSKEIEPLAEKLFNINETDLSAITCLVLSGTFIYTLCDLYMNNPKKEFACIINFLKYSNLYYKKICFEYGFDYFTERVESGYNMYELAVSRAKYFLNDFPLEDFYTEICKRKNILYIVEVWRQKYKNIYEINNFLNKDILFEDIYKALPKDTVLIDFHFDIMFVLYPTGDIFLHTNDLSKFSRIIMFDTASFSSYKYKKGYLIDYFNIRHIGSIYDLILPNKKRILNNALIVSSDKLKFSEFECEYVKNILNDNNINTRYLKGKRANISMLQKALGENYSIIHYSSHGQKSNNSIGILLSDDNIYWDFNTNTSASLIIYSLCFGANQTEKNNLSGFIKFSLLSGANNIIAPINKVDDLSSAFLIKEFYNIYLLGNPVESALRQAIKRIRSITKRELAKKYNINITGKKYPFDSPEHWSGWVCYSKEEL